MSMTVGGWAFMSIAWIAISSLVVFCFYRVLATGEKHVSSPNVIKARADFSAANSLEDALFEYIRHRNRVTSSWSSESAAAALGVEKSDVLEALFNLQKAGKVKLEK